MINAVRRYFARRRIKRMFGSYVSPALVERMVQSGEEPKIGAADVELTAFFANVPGYVGIAEQVPLRRLPELMNAYFEAGTAAIQGEGGTLDKYIGDVIVAMFGAPARLPDHALRACIGALRCQSAVAALRERLRGDAEPWPDLARQIRVRIGLHTGVAMVGNLGTRHRFNYTMMGDNVNLAARMEPVAKNYGVGTLCTDATQSACEAKAPGRILFRSLGCIVVKGRAQPLGLYEPVALRHEASDRLLECVQVFEQGLARYRERDWHGAVAFFAKSALLERDQSGIPPELAANPSTIFSRLAQSFHANPGSGPVLV